jgi:hypothetical protein
MHKNNSFLKVTIANDTGALGGKIPAPLLENNKENQRN